MIRTNERRLARFRLQGAIVPPIGFGWEISRDGVNRVVPSVGGITLNFKVGDLANQYVADHLEPGVSTSTEPNPTSNRRNPRNKGYNIYSCIGNEAEVISGSAKGAKGRVTGHHGGVEHVLIDFNDTALIKLTYDDKIMITSFGVGLAINGFEETVKVFSLDPALLGKMRLQPKGSGKASQLVVPVAATVPAVVMGSGLGSVDPFQGDYDIQTSDDRTNKQYGLDRLKLGDLVALLDQDSTQGWSYRQGSVSIGVIIHGDSKIAGHGPGCQTVMTCRDGELVPKVDPKANIGRYLRIGRYRK